VATPLEISTRPGADGIPVVTVAGEIDMSNAERFRDALDLAAAAAAAATADGGGSFVVDLTGVEYLDSAGVHALFGHAPRIRLIAGPVLEPVLTVSGLSGIASMRDDSLREPQ
jgi:anti-sigma B factor antagonist